MNKCKLISIITAGISILTNGCSAAPPPLPPTGSYTALEINSADVQKLTDEMLRTEGGDSLTIRRNEKTGIPYEICGDFADIRIHSPEEALQALMQFGDIMKIENASFCCTEVDEERVNCISYTLQQLYQGVLVDGGQFQLIAAQPDGRLTMVRGTYQDGIELDTVPGKDAEACLDAVRFEKRQSVSHVNLVVYNREGSDYLLCWRYDVKSASVDKNKVVYVDANTGELIQERSTVIIN